MGEKAKFPLFHFSFKPKAFSFLSLRRRARVIKPLLKAMPYGTHFGSSSQELAPTVLSLEATEKLLFSASIYFYYMYFNIYFVFLQLKIPIIKKTSRKIIAIF